MPGGGQTNFLAVSGAGQTPDRLNVRRHLLPYPLEHPTLVNVRVGELVGEYQELIHIQHHMHLQPTHPGSSIDFSLFFMSASFPFEKFFIRASVSQETKLFFSD